MKQNLRLLKTMLTILGDYNFYSSSVHHGDITLQGRYDSNLALRIKDLKFTSKVDDNGYVSFQRVVGGQLITITLT